MKKKDKWYKFTINRNEANFDRACDEAKKYLYYIELGQDEEGELENVKNYNGDEIVEMKFHTYKRRMYSRGGESHWYTFKYMVTDGDD